MLKAQVRDVKTMIGMRPGTSRLTPPSEPVNEVAAIGRLREQYAAARRGRVRCPSCGSAAARPLVKGDRHGLDLTTVICASCALGYLSPRPASAWFSSFYQNEYWPLYLGSKFRDADDMYERDRSDERARQILDQVFAHMPEAPRSCLDIGCGQGALLADLRRRLPAARLFGIEPSEDGAVYTHQRHGLDVWRGDLDAFVARRPAERYSLLTAIHVLEHILQPTRFLRHLRALVEPDGYVYVEVPDLLSPIWQGVAYFHIAHTLYWSEPSLIGALERYGFETVACVRGASDQWPWAVGVLARARGHAPRRRPVADVEQIVAHVRRQFDAGASTEPAAAPLSDDQRRVAALLRRWVLAERPVHVWGAGSLARAVLGLMHGGGSRVVGVVDSDSRKWDTRFCDVPVSGPAALEHDPGSPRPFVLVASSFSQEIEPVLTRLGYESPDDYFVFPVH
jgi:SAM-dependent methyltransferase